MRNRKKNSVIYATFVHRRRTINLHIRGIITTTSSLDQKSKRSNSIFHIDTKLHSPFIERVDVRNNYKPLLFVSDRSKNLDFEKLLMSTKIPRRISRSNISSDDVVKARWKARRTTVINSSIKLVRSNIPANRSRHSLQRSDKIAFYDSQGATSPFARFQRRKIHAYEIILSNINLASVVAKSTTRIVAPREKKKKKNDG